MDQQGDVAVGNFTPTILLLNLPSLRAACTPDGCPPCVWLDATGSTREMTLAWRPRQSRPRVQVCERYCVPVSPVTPSATAETTGQ